MKVTVSVTFGHNCCKPGHQLIISYSWMIFLLILNKKNSCKETEEDTLNSKRGDAEASQWKSRKRGRWWITLIRRSKWTAIMKEKATTPSSLPLIYNPLIHTYAHTRNPCVLFKKLFFIGYSTGCFRMEQEWAKKKKKNRGSATRTEEGERDR